MKRDKWKRKKKWNIGKTPPHIIHHEPPHLVAIIKKIQDMVKHHLLRSKEIECTFTTW
jgi:hypothetical protein